MAHTTPDDTVADALLRAAGRGDVRALGAFYDRTAPTVYGLLRSILREQAPTERAIEQIYLHLWRYAPRFDPDLGSARSLLLRAAHHEVIQHMATMVAATTPPAASSSGHERE